MTRVSLWLFILALGILTLTACESDEDAADAQDASEGVEATESVATQQATPEPTTTPEPEPTEKPEATPTPEPTPTPAPTPTPEPMPTPEPTPTPAPTPEPTPTPTEDEIKAQYRSDLDIREVDKNVEDYHLWKLYYEGEVLTIQEFDSGSFLQLQIQYPGGDRFDTVTIVVITEVDTTGIYEDDQVALWGYPYDTYTFTNAFGGRVSQPQFYGEYLEKLN